MNKVQILPDLLSLSRVPMGGLIVVFYSNEIASRYLVGLFVVALATTTDFADGYVARKFGTPTARGYLLDGLGDRAVYIALIVCFYGEGRLGIVLAWLLVLREVAIYAVRVLEADWFSLLASTRRSSLVHAAFIRCWFLFVLVRDGIVVFVQPTRDDHFAIGLMNAVLLSGTLISGYWTIGSTVYQQLQSPKEIHHAGSGRGQAQQVNHNPPRPRVGDGS